MVEEEDMDEDDDDSDDDEDDVKLVLTGPANRVDLRSVHQRLGSLGYPATRLNEDRKPQQQQSNVIGIGKWAHTSTGQAPAAVTPSQSTPTKGERWFHQPLCEGMRA